MTSGHDVIVIGCGAMGAAATLALAQRGARVLALDRDGVPNNTSSHHGDSRMIRLAYYEHPDYVPLLKEAHALWKRLESESGETLFHETGGLYMGRAGLEFVESSRRSAEQHGLPHEMLSAEDLRREHPQFRLPDDHVALFEPMAGMLLCERIIRAQARLARACGAEIREHEAVQSWRAEPNGVVVRTTTAEHRADRLLLTAGPWSARLIESIAPRLTVTRQPMGWVDPLRADRLALGALPCWAVGAEDGSLLYGFPMRPGERAFKVARHLPLDACDPETVDRGPRADDEATFRADLARLLPEADGPLREIRVCMYTNSPDGHFIVDRHPDSERVVIAAGFSGHGFKFASVMGEALADLALDGRSRRPLEFLGLRRFGESGYTVRPLKGADE
ncbi:MAG: N-methyl-L-tryptophan oxidase [Planctomycetota bacterium]|nr:N-methyl-L-tryptophan oxidase [Planctomycetota bacterium]